MACHLDTECSTVYDYKCDGRYFYHCKKDSRIESHESTCIYSKADARGNVYLYHPKLKESDFYLILQNMLITTNFLYV